MTNLKLTTAITQSLKHVAAIEAEAKAERERLETMLRSVKGTRNDMVPLVGAPTKARTITEQLEATLREHVTMHEWQLAKALGITPGAAQRLCSGLAREHKLYNLGTEDHPRWAWVVGESATPTELTAHVLGLISAVPMTLRQIEAATNVRRNRVNGSLVQIQRDPALRKRLDNLGTERVHVHYIRPAKR